MKTGAATRMQSGVKRLLAPALLLVLVRPELLADQEQKPSFTSGTQIVEIDLRVFDSSGKFVPGLSVDDFTLQEDGVPQEIRALYLVSSGTVAPSSSSPGPGSAPLAAKPTWLFVFDTPHLTPAGLARTRDALKVFVVEHFRDGDFAGIVVNGRMVNNRISSVKEEIARAVASVTLPGDLGSRQLDLRTWPRLMDEDEARRIVDNDQYAIDAAVRRACADEPDACRGTSPELFIREKAARVMSAAQTATRQTIDTVTALSSGLARIPGPKTVVVFSEGFVLQGLETQLSHAIGNAARAGARFYTIDARGQNRGPGTDNLDAAALSDTATGARFDTQSDGTASLAFDTGGIAIRNENNFGRALDAINRDTGTYYVLAYSPSNPAFDGKFRAVEVRTTKPGLRIRARKGYIALQPSRMLVPTTAHSEGHTTRSEPIDAETSGVPAPPSGASSLPITTSTLDHLPGIPILTPAAATGLRGRDNAAELVMELAGDAGRATAGATIAGEGWSAYERGDVKRASRLLNQAAAIPGARPWVFYASGFAQLAEGRPEDAARAWEHVRETVPEFKPVYYDLADAYLQLQDGARAVTVLRLAQQRWPSDSEVHNALGVAQIRRGALDDAIESFKKAVAAAPDESLGYFNLARAYHMRYFKSHRYNSTLQKWFGNERDREAAAINFQRYVEMGGPYAQQAKDALAALAWK